MISLAKYIQRYNFNKIDGHIHLFDWRMKNIFDLYYPPMHLDTFVGFLGVDFKNIDKYDYNCCAKYYDDFIQQYCSNYNIILLSGGIDAKSVIDNFKRHNDIIKGFGELLCYDQYDDIKLPYKNLNWVEEVLNYNTQKLPIFIHYSLVSEKCVSELDDLLSQYKDTPIILCHCGLPNIHEGSYENEYDIIFNNFLKLYHKYNNLYTDVCDSAFIYLKNYPDKFNKLDPDRLIVGSDITPNHIIYEKDIYKSLSKFDLWKDVITNEPIKKLFNV